MKTLEDAERRPRGSTRAASVVAMITMIDDPFDYSEPTVYRRWLALLDGANHHPSQPNLARQPLRSNAFSSRATASSPKP